VDPAVSWGIAAVFLRAALMLAVLFTAGALYGPPSWTSQPASVVAGRATEAWPREGSMVAYELRSSFAAPDGSYRNEVMARLALSYDGESWSGACTGESREVVDGVASTSDWASPSGGRPAVAPADARPGDTVVLALLDDPGVAEACRHRGETVQVLGDRDGALSAEELPETSGYQEVAATWDRRTGLVLEWTRSTSGGSVTGRLVATDAFPDWPAAA
jgi:hypothetical protein